MKTKPKQKTRIDMYTSPSFDSFLDRLGHGSNVAVQTVVDNGNLGHGERWLMCTHQRGGGAVRTMTNDDSLFD